MEFIHACLAGLHCLHVVCESLFAGLLLPQSLPLLAGGAGLPKALGLAGAGAWGGAQVGELLADDLLLLAVSE